mgnify:CR=1 FL=1
MTISETLASARKIVIKIGSNTLSKADGTQNTEFMASFARQCKNLISKGKQIVVVSSGAQVSGVSTLKEWARKKDVHFRQIGRAHV